MLGSELAAAQGAGNIPHGVEEGPAGAQAGRELQRQFTPRSTSSRRGPDSGHSITNTPTRGGSAGPSLTQ